MAVAGVIAATLLGVSAPVRVVGAAAQQPPGMPGKWVQVCRTSTGQQVAWTCGMVAVMSGDGHKVFFENTDPAFGPGDPDRLDMLLVRDVPSTSLNTVVPTVDGHAPSGITKVDSSSLTGRFVTVFNDGSNVSSVPRASGPASYLIDRTTHVTKLIDVNTAGVQANWWSSYTSASDDGRYVLFGSSATDLVAGDTNGWPDLFLRDMTAGKTIRISVTSTGAQLNSPNYFGYLSGNGRYIAWGAGNAIAANLPADAAVRTDRTTLRSVRIDTNAKGQPGNQPSAVAGISADGRFVLLNSYATNLTGTSVGPAIQTMYLKDMTTGSVVRVPPAGGLVSRAFMSPNARYVAYELASPIPGVRDGTYRFDRVTGKTVYVSVHDDGTPLTGIGEGTYLMPGVGNDGSVLVRSDSAPLTSGDTTETVELYVRRPA